MRKYEMIKELEIKENEKASVKTNKHKENMQYIDINEKVFAQKFKENLQKGHSRIQVISADVPFSRYEVLGNGENIWIQRRYELLADYICAFWTLRGYTCHKTEKFLEIRL